MRKWIFSLLIAGALAVTGAVALAQTTLPTPTPKPESAEEPASPEASTPVSATIILTDEAYVQLDLAAGFPLDPFFVSVNGGGPVDASTLGEGCVGWISQPPVLSLDWEGEADLARIFYYSDHDPSLVIQLPDGTFQCNDNANRLLLDPSLEFENPGQGVYRIWVGNAEAEGLIPGVLVVTTKEQFSASTFQLQGLIKRPAESAKAIAILDALPEGPELKAVLSELLAEEEGLPVLEEGVDLTASVEITGEIPGFVWPVSADSPHPACSGVSTGESQLDFDVVEGTRSVRILFDGAADGGLIVFTPDGAALCTDDSEEGANRNPVIDIQNPAPGNYAVMISRIADVDVLTGTVTVTTDMERTPSLLEPAATTPHSN